MKKTDIGTITRTILIIIALINQGLVIAGKNPLPFDRQTENVCVNIYP